MIHHKFFAILASIVIAITCSWPSAWASDVKNVVIVPGAFTDGSGWRPVSDILAAKGYKVTIVQRPLTSLAEDVAATKRVLDLQDGPSILVGHSYGGMVISDTGNASRPREVADLIMEAGDAVPR